MAASLGREGVSEADGEGQVCQAGSGTTERTMWREEGTGRGARVLSLGTGGIVSPQNLYCRRCPVPCRVLDDIPAS